MTLSVSTVTLRGSSILGMRRPGASWCHSKHTLARRRLRGPISQPAGRGGHRGTLPTPRNTGSACRRARTAHRILISRRRHNTSADELGVRRHRALRDVLRRHARRATSSSTTSSSPVRCRRRSPTAGQQFDVTGLQIQEQLPATVVQRRRSHGPHLAQRHADHHDRRHRRDARVDLDRGRWPSTYRSRTRSRRRAWPWPSRPTPANGRARSRPRARTSP